MLTEIEIKKLAEAMVKHGFGLGDVETTTRRLTISSTEGKPLPTADQWLKNMNLPRSHVSMLLEIVELQKATKTQ